MPKAITVGGVDLGVAWKASIVLADVDTILLEIRPEQLISHQARFRAATSFVAGPHRGIFSTWPDGTNGPRWVIVLLSEEVQKMTLHDGTVERSIAPVRTGASRLPQIGTFLVTSHLAHLDLYGEGDEKVGVLYLEDPYSPRSWQPRDLTAPAPIGPVTRILSG